MRKYEVDNNIILKNTLVLYLRMFILLFVSLFTTRIVLQLLGVSDFGIFNVVGGIVALSSFIINALSGGYQRFLNYEMGKSSESRIRSVFSNSIIIQIALSLIIFFLAESIGLWFLNTQMVFPPTRMYAVNTVYQLSIITFIANVFRTPYDALIIAHEKLNVFAYCSIFEVVGRLFLVLLVKYIAYDSLIVYSSFIFIPSLILLLFYIVYCHKSYIESHFNFTSVDRIMIKEMIEFTSWNLIGNLAYTMKSQGLNILLNLFFGTVINAARGVAFQISTALNRFVSNFQIAFRPQMIKSYAYGDTKKTLEMMYFMTKVSFILLAVICMPIFFEIDFVLSMWLGNNVPNYTAIFVKLLIITNCVDAFGAPISVVMHATGKVKKYQIFTSLVQLLILPISYVFLKLDYPPETVMYISLFFTIITQIVRLLVLKIYVHFSLKDYLQKIIFPIIVVTLLFPIFPIYIINNFSSSWLRFIFLSFIVEIVLIILIYVLIISKKERIIINSYVRGKFQAK